MSPAIVDEVDEVLGVDEKRVKTSKTLLSQASSPLTMTMKPFYCMAYSTLFHDVDHVDVVTTMVGCLRYFLVDICIMHDPTILMRVVRVGVVRLLVVLRKWDGNMHDDGSKNDFKDFPKTPSGATNARGR